MSSPSFDARHNGVLIAPAYRPRRDTTHSVEYGDEIPEARRRALPCASTCMQYQSGRDGRVVLVGISRR